MARFTVRISARKQGSIGQSNAEKRIYVIEADDEECALYPAIHKAYAEGLESVTVTSLISLIPFRFKPFD